MTIATFYADVRAAIGRGTANDLLLPGWAQEAINLLENEHTFQWMRRTVELPIVPGPNSNRLVLPNTRIKAIDWVKYGETQGAGATATTVYSDPLPAVDPAHVLSLDQGTANGHYLDGVDTIVLDARATTASTLFAHYYEYTQWPADPAQNPPVLARHYHGFKAHFMMTAAANLRAAELGQIWSGVSQRGIAAMLAADGEMEWKARRGMAMGSARR